MSSFMNTLIYILALLICSTHANVLFGWGADLYGELGDGATNVERFNPVIFNMSGILANKTVTHGVIGALGFFAGLTAYNLLFAVGSNGNGYLGDGTTIDRIYPVAVNQRGVLANKTIIALTASWATVLALASDNTMYAWGYNGYGQLGDGTTIERHNPVRVIDTHGVFVGKTIMQIACGVHTCAAVTVDGLVRTWGWNAYGTLCVNSDILPDQPNPVAIYNGGVILNVPIVSIAWSQFTLMLLGKNGRIYGCGYNGDGEIGSNTTLDSAAPVATFTGGVLFNKTVIAIAAGGANTMAITQDGILVAFGDNSFGQLGHDPSLIISMVPVIMNTSNVNGTVIQFGVGYLFATILTSANKIYSIGAGVDAQLGNGIAGDVSHFVPVNITGVMAGYAYYMLDIEYNNVIVITTFPITHASPIAYTGPIAIVLGAFSCIVLLLGVCMNKHTHA